ncbi:hypothetical protein O181_040790 [Austropuccinia psidii MF-1]|uniref:Uncharacterized protein n=1 Tax=Austropuccinia psidii MF-1 TaxID=1389203 RepID=A0A9Q3DDU2_9BASI|nr:hypothetical protein [Austropuccinia psidii MF-1]
MSYTKRPVKGALTNLKAALADYRIFDAPFLPEDLLQTLNHLSPRSDRALLAVFEFLQKIRDTTDTPALIAPDNPERSKVIPDSGVFRYVSKQSIGAFTFIHLQVQRRSPKNAIPLPGEAKRASNRKSNPFSAL